MFAKKVIAKTISAVFAGALTIACIEPMDPFPSELDVFFTAREAEGFSGVIIFARGDKILLRKAYGVSACDGAPLKPSDVFLIGSITKVFTKVALYRLVAEGRVSLGDPISKFLPEVPEDKAGITVGQLAEHQSGLDDIIDKNGQPVPYTPDWDYLPVTKDEIVARAMHSKLIYAPGEDEVYSNLGYSLLAAIIETVSGEPYEAYVRKAVFQPLGMNHTGYILPDWSNVHYADGCDEGTKWSMPFPAGRWMVDGPSWNLRGNGGMMGTADDLITWLSAMGRSDFLPSKIIDDYWMVAMDHSRTFDEPATGAAGGNGIYNSYYVWIKDSDFRLVMISNNSVYQVESYLDVVFPMMKSYRERLTVDEQSKIK